MATSTFAPHRVTIAAHEPAASAPDRSLRWGWAWFSPCLLAVAGVAQSPAPGGASVAYAQWLREGEVRLQREDPVLAWQAFERALAEGASGASCQLGLGRVHLMLGRPNPAQRCAERLLAVEPDNQSGMALQVLAQIRAREFDAAARTAGRFVLAVDDPGAELLAARGSALFRVQRTDEAATTYQVVVALDRDHAEAHLRLGSGLLPPTEVRIGDELRGAVAAARRGELRGSIATLQRVVQREPGNPIAHRLLGEALFNQRFATSMAATDEAFRRLAATLPKPQVRAVPIAEFVRGYRELDPGRAAVVDGAVALFASRLHKLIAVGGSHDLLLELDRTTDAPTRANLRGRRTFDGRVWDDVRGIGGLTAATGIEALDESAQFGFDTLAHELAHQVHFFAFGPLERARIKALYNRALQEDTCLDYYAASNEAEYFGQGVEAFRSFGKRPGGETTHGHTRFELYRVDRALHDFVKGLVEFDPLDGPQRAAVLRAAFAVALRCGRPEDGITAAEWLDAGPERDELLAQARAALQQASPR